MLAPKRPFLAVPSLCSSEGSAKCNTLQKVSDLKDYFLPRGTEFALYMLCRTKEDRQYAFKREGSTYQGQYLHSASLCSSEGSANIKSMHFIEDSSKVTRIGHVLNSASNTASLCSSEQSASVRNTIANVPLIIIHFKTYLGLAQCGWLYLGNIMPPGAAVKDLQSEEYNSEHTISPRQVNTYASTKNDVASCTL